MEVRRQSFSFSRWPGPVPVSPTKASSSSYSLTRSQPNLSLKPLTTSEGKQPEKESAESPEIEIHKDPETSEEGRKVKSKPDPRVPTKAEIEEHNVSHIPPRSWCPHCVAGRGIESPHRSGDDESVIPKISMDYFYMGQEDSEDTLPLLAVKTRPERMIFSHALLSKGVHEYSVQVLIADIKQTGQKRFIFQSDQEPAILALKTEVMNRLQGYEPIPQESPIGDHQANGDVENAVRELGKQIRTIKSFVEAKYQIELGPRHPLLSWLIPYAGQLLSRFQVGTNGRTGYENNYGHKFKKQVVAFGECVNYVPLRVGGRLNKLDDRTEKGVFVGLKERSEELLVMTPNGVYRARTMFRKPIQERFDSEFLKQCKGTPWQPVPSEDGASDLPKTIVIPASQGSMPEPVVTEPQTRRVYIKKSDLVKYGYTQGCPGCDAARTGQKPKNHLEQCRKRIELEFEKDEAERARLEQAKRRRSDSEVVEDSSKKSKQSQDPESLVRDPTARGSGIKRSAEVPVEELDPQSEQVQRSQPAESTAQKRSAEVPVEELDPRTESVPVPMDELRLMSIRVKEDFDNHHIPCPSLTCASIARSLVRLGQDSYASGNSSGTHVSGNSSGTHVSSQSLVDEGWILDLRGIQFEPGVGRVKRVEPDSDGALCSLKPWLVVGSSYQTDASGKAQINHYIHSLYKHQMENKRYFLHEVHYHSGAIDVYSNSWTIRDHLSRLSSMDIQSEPFKLDAILSGIVDQQIQLGGLDTSCMQVGVTDDEPVYEFHPDWLASMDTYGQFVDDVFGGVLDPDRVQAARQEEIQYYQKNVYKKVPVTLCWEVTGAKPISTRWVDCNKGDANNPEYRSRWVARDIRKVWELVWSASTPPLEVLKWLLAKCVEQKRSQRGKRLKLVFIDIKKAHLTAPASRRLFVELPDGDREEGMCAELLTSMYGMRDAAFNWENDYASTYKDGGYEQGVACSCIFHNKSEDSYSMVHGDDMIVLADDDEISRFINLMKAKYQLTVRAILGDSPKDQQSVKILNRYIKLSLDRNGDYVLEYEADPRHAEMIIKDLKLENAKSVATPGVKKTLKDLESPILPRSQHTAFRSLTMRACYLGQDRTDIQFAAKELARDNQTPTEASFAALKRLGRYLIGKPRVVQVFSCTGTDPGVVSVRVDTDDAGCLKTRKSSTGMVLRCGSHVVRTTSTTQATLKLSSGESEYNGIVKGASHALGMRSVLEDLGQNSNYSLDIGTDSTAARGMCNRKGIGKVRHLGRRLLWVQQRHANGDLGISKVKGTENEPDILTKHVSQAECEAAMQRMNLEFRGSLDRPAAPKIRSDDVAHAQLNNIIAKRFDISAGDESKEDSIIKGDHTNIEVEYALFDVLCHRFLQYLKTA